MEGLIRRDPAAAAASEHDPLIVGGGIYGVALALEAARQGWRPLLIERGDFGGETSFNSLRIVHGGLRYLQTLDLSRFRESVAERRWLLRAFPDQVRPLSCLMPLYGKGTRRPSVFRGALALDDLLSRGRNDDVPPDRRLPAGRVLSRSQTLRTFPGADPDGLLGGALWHDAVMEDSERLLIEMLRWACASGAAALNYVEATDLLLQDGRVAGVRATDRPGGSELELRGGTVINCAGPWCRELACRFDRDVPELFRYSIAINAVLDRPSPADTALAVASKKPDARTFFLHPWKGRLFAGTLHAPWSGRLDTAAPPEDLVLRFLEELNAAHPALRLQRGDVLRLRWGFLPAAAEGTEQLAVRPVVHDHAREGGPAGLFSVSGVKFTTARKVAERTLAVLPSAGGPPSRSAPRPAPRAIPCAADLDVLLEQDRDALRSLAHSLVREESVVRVEDLLFRRTDWGVDPRREPERATALAELLHEIRAGAVR